MKKMFASFLCIFMCISLVPAANAAGTRDFAVQARLATQLKDLGLFLGVGEKEDGTTDFALERAPTRAEALTMLVRALGKGTIAESHTKSHPFYDVPAWADGIVSYAYENGLTKGVSETQFGAADIASAEMYLTFMLRALGYSDGTAGDFTWDAPWTLAERCGILPARVDRKSFLRADAVDVTCAALFATLNGSAVTLHERLASEHVFTVEQFQSVFPEKPSFDADENGGQTTEEQGAYGQALNKAISSISEVSHRLEAVPCTVLAGVQYGVPHGPAVTLTLIYKPGAALGEGKTVSLPLPQENAIGKLAMPENLSLSQDGMTLTYSCHFDQRLVGFEGEPEEFIVHEAGTYHYTVDLATGEATLEIRSD